MIVNLVFCRVTLGGAVSDYFACSSDPFPPTEVPRPALLWGFVPSFIVTCHAAFSWYPWEAWVFPWKKVDTKCIVEWGGRWEEWKERKLQLGCIIWENEWMNEWSFKSKTKNKRILKELIAGTPVLGSEVKFSDHCGSGKLQMVQYGERILWAIDLCSFCVLCGSLIGEGETISPFLVTWHSSVGSVVLQAGVGEDQYFPCSFSSSPWVA